MTNIAIDSPRLARELREASESDLIALTRNGKPFAYVLPAALYDAEDIGYMTDPSFWQMIQERRLSGNEVPLETVMADLRQRERRQRKRKTSKARV